MHICYSVNIIIYTLHMDESLDVLQVQKKTILVVEDNILISEMYIYKLKREGYEVHLASDGLEAIKFIFE